MISEFVDAAYVGCATDSQFVEPTCAMLSSLDENGNIPEAMVIVADFGLTRQERDDISLSAGQLGERLRFLPLDRQSTEIVAIPKFDFPFPLLGRLVIPGQITTPRARLITIDSDMVINRTLRPLFEMSMRRYPLAAVHDPIAVRSHYGRDQNFEYFNAGLMLIDIDSFRDNDYASKVMRLFASYDDPPKWLDQDALNEVLKNNWLTLDRRWNYFHAGDWRGFTAADYESADVVHFAGPKPWHGAHHPGAHLYEHHANRAAQKRLPPQKDSPLIDRVFAASCYELLLGREIESDAIFTDRAHMTRKEFTDVVRSCEEFIGEVVDKVATGTPFAGSRFEGRPTLVHKTFVLEYLQITPMTARRVPHVGSWRELLELLVHDRFFMNDR